MQLAQTFTAFVGTTLIARGELKKVLLKTKQHVEARGIAGEQGSRADACSLLLIFDDSNGAQVEFDLRGTPEEMLARELPAPRPAGPGRPKLGVSSREVSLLPRHWDWLEQEPQGLSATLRRLVEEAMKRDPEQQRMRNQRAAASRFMTAMAGNLPNYEEASRALFAGDQAHFEELIRDFPKDVRKHLERMTRSEADKT